MRDLRFERCPKHGVQYPNGVGCPTCKAEKTSICGAAPMKAKVVEFRGAQFGVRVSEYPPKDRGNGKLIQIIGEDDGNWFEDGSPFSSLWLRDLIGVLEEAERGWK